MTPEEAPTGTVCVVGHPANGLTATKQINGDWVTNTSPRRTLDFDTTHKAMRAVHIPGRTS